MIDYEVNWHSKRAWTTAALQVLLVIFAKDGELSSYKTNWTSNKVVRLGIAWTYGLEDSFDIKPLEANDVPKLKVMTDEEDWNYSQEYLEFMGNRSGGGFLAAFGRDGQLISHCGTERIRDDLGMITLYITHPDYRGQGIGKTVFDACMKHLGDINVALDSWDVTRNMYASMGFSITSFWMSYLRGIPKVDYFHETWSNNKVTIVDSSQVEPALLKEYDDTVHIISRHEFIDKWLARDGLVCKVAMEEEKIVGYGCIWPASSGSRVMPLYAGNSSAALALWRDFCLSSPPGKPICVAAPSENKDAVQLFADSLNPVKPRYAVRLYTKKEVKVHLEPVYSVCNFGSCLI